MAIPASDNADVLCDQGKSLLRGKKFAEARDLFLQAIEVDARSIPAHEGAAAAAFQLNDLAAAAAHYQKISTLDVRRAEPLINLGAVYNRMRDYGAASRTLRQAVGKNKKSPDAYYNLGIAYKGQNQHSQAISAYKEALKIDPQMAEAHQNLGNLYLEMGNLQQSIAHFEKALAINPKFEKAGRSLERAKASLQESKRLQKPFGRLVQEDDVASRKAKPAYRHLSEQERFDDRERLHQHAEETEHLAAVAISRLRDELCPSILKLQQISAQSDEAKALYRESKNAAALAARFSAAVEALHAKVQAIRQYEQVIRGWETPAAAPVGSLDGAPP